MKPEDNTTRAQLPRSMEEGLLVVSAAFIGRKRATEFGFRGQADPLSSAGGNKPLSPLKPHALFCCIYLSNFYLFIIDFSQRFSVLPRSLSSFLVGQCATSRAPQMRAQSERAHGWWIKNTRRKRKKKKGTKLSLVSDQLSSFHTGRGMAFLSHGKKLPRELFDPYSF